MKRVSLSKKTRFDVFKRDGFSCQYCGRHPPEVILEVDHIIPVSENGTNDSDNLITSCFDCNRGKRDHSLSSVPESLKEKAKRIKESEKQLNEYQKILSIKRERLELEKWKIAWSLFGKEGQEEISVRKDWLISIKRFIDNLGFEDVFKASEIARSRYGFYSEKRLFLYFAKICWNWIKGEYHG